MGKSRTPSPILVIDDEINILKLFRQIQSRHGYAVETAESGEEGIRKIKTTHYSLILTDIKMPGISGHQVFDYLWNTIQRPTPIIGMSGTPWLLDQGDFDAVIEKPCSNKEMLDLINRFVAEK